MESFLVTFIAFSLAFALLGLGFIFANKSLKKGCGLNPNDPEGICSVCGKKASDPCEDDNEHGKKD